MREEPGGTRSSPYCRLHVDVALTHLYDVSRLVGVLLEHQHGGSVRVDIELLLQAGRL